GGAGDQDRLVFVVEDVHAGRRVLDLDRKRDTGVKRDSLMLGHRLLAHASVVLDPRFHDPCLTVAAALVLGQTGRVRIPSEVDLKVAVGHLVGLAEVNRVTRSKSNARWQKRCSEPMSWVTNTIVLPWSRNELKTSKHFCWNAASPTASTSSISRMSASTWIATENARRTYIPEE